MSYFGRMRTLPFAEPVVKAETPLTGPTLAQRMCEALKFDHAKGNADAGRLASNGLNGSLPLSNPGTGASAGKDAAVPDVKSNIQ